MQQVVFTFQAAWKSIGTERRNKQIIRIWVMIVSIVLERQKARTIHNKAVSFVRLENLSNAGSQRQYLRSQKVLQMIESSE